MGDTNRKRMLLVSSAVILLCMIIIVGMTFSLFTDSKKVYNHLKAGDLEVTLKRTYLEYRILDTDGKLYTTKVEDDVNFTMSTIDNVFGIDSKNIRIAPGSYFKVDMQVINVGDVAFTYDVGIMLTGEANALSDQLVVTVTFANGTKVTKKLSEMVNGVTIQSGELLRGSNSQTFSVEVVFIDDDSVNNAAQAQVAEFDLIVSAIQATK